MKDATAITSGVLGLRFLSFSLRRQMLYPAELQARSYDGPILPRSRLGCKVTEEKQPTGEGRDPDYAALFQHHPPWKTRSSEIGETIACECSQVYSVRRPLRQREIPGYIGLTKG